MKKFEELIDVSLDEASRHLQKAINYGDYLAEEKKNAQLAELFAREQMRRDISIAKSDKSICSAGDAKAREEQAENAASESVKKFETAKIESDFVTNLFKNNHDRVEALRSIMSSKKQNLGNYQGNQIG